MSYFQWIINRIRGKNYRRREEISLDEEQLPNWQRKEPTRPTSTARRRYQKRQKVVESKQYTAEQANGILTSAFGNSTIGKQLYINMIHRRGKYSNENLFNKMIDAIAQKDKENNPKLKFLDDTFEILLRMEIISKYKHELLKNTRISTKMENLKYYLDIMSHSSDPTTIAVRKKILKEYHKLNKS